ncbi:unnamed protein product [Cladocopium goreaui]|uniref:Uncharacterized protein n=1 Tax=Cladocopium goreaui TaxID=2562237 RepID=A0A9P1CLU2_9DINO|nr:unnamed protein product [Cladocopium goreaui]
MEALLERTLNRIENLEGKMSEQARTVTPADQPKEVSPQTAKPSEKPKGIPEPSPEDEVSESEGSDDDDDEWVTTPSGQRVNITSDALRMRARRMCERKPTGRCNVDSATAEAYKTGGESRELLEMALLECLAKHGVSRKSYKKVKADFVTKCRLVRERLESRQTEVKGKWMTQEAMRKQFSVKSIKSMVAYCTRFPESLVRAWKYDDKVSEYFVITDDHALHKKEDTTAERHETELDET